jgi:conjugal transfer mating pair stabilization protein TraN
VVGTNCTETTTTTVPATPTYSCPTGATLSGTECLGTTTTSALVTYSCPPGSTLSGTNCITTTTVPATVTYSCVDGSAPVSGVCFIHSAHGSWTDGCAPFEASAGNSLPTP